jgi:hypothetical protein
VLLEFGYTRLVGRPVFVDENLLSFEELYSIPIATHFIITNAEPE